MNTLTVALAQIDIALGDPAANLTTVRGLAAQAAAQHADLLVLPELWSTGYDLGRAEELADDLDDGLFAEISALARSQHIAIAGSTLARRSGQPTKIHLFGLMHEDRYLAAGQATPVFESPWGLSALAICYDLRFPELFRSYAARGAGVILLPSEWPHPRLEHWRTLVRARAIEDQCFFIACNRVGADRNNRFCGHSMVVDPWGATLVEGDEEPGLLLATLDLSTVAEVRERMSVLRDRRPELY